MKWALWLNNNTNQNKKRSCRNKFKRPKNKKLKRKNKNQKQKNIIFNYKKKVNYKKLLRTFPNLNNYPKRKAFLNVQLTKLKKMVKPQRKFKMKNNKKNKHS